jgi:transposase
MFGVLCGGQEDVMDLLYSRCCGLDVHKKSITACILVAEGSRPQKWLRRFGTMTRDIQELADWLHSSEVTHVAMESTGVYWKPIWNVLEGAFELLLVNAAHIKNVPGRKTEHEGLRMDRAVAAAWVAARELRA